MVVTVLDDGTLCHCHTACNLFNMIRRALVVKKFCPQSNYKTKLTPLRRPEKNNKAIYGSESARENNVHYPITNTALETYQTE